MSFLATQFLGAYNDNVYKTVVSLLVVTESSGSGLLSLAAIIFLIPSFIFSGYSAYFSDRYQKHKVLRITKSLEIVAMILAFFVLEIGDENLMLVVLFLLATQSVFFSPSKYGIVPEMLPASDLSRANGLLELTTFAAIIMGSASAGLLLHFFADHLLVVSIYMLFVAVVGFCCSIFITPVKASGSQKPWTWNPIAEIIKGFGRVKESRELLMVVLAISFFWGLGTAVQLNIILFGKQLAFGPEMEPLGDLGITVLNATLAVGIALGGFFAGWLSGDKIETGIIPIGALGIAIGSIMVGISPPNVFSVYCWLLVTGFFSGLYMVPLNAMLQDRPDAQEKGRLIATNNFLNGIFMLLAAMLIWLLRSVMGIAPDTIFVLFGIATLILACFFTYFLPNGLIRVILWILTHTLYRTTIVGGRHVPLKGPAVIVCNHVSYVDGLILSASVPRMLRYMVYKPIYDLKIFNWLFRMIHAIPVEGGKPNQVKESIARAREQLEQGHVICIFAEGAITRTGNLLPFRKGLEKIVQDMNIPIIPAHLDKLWDSIFSFKKNKVFWRIPKRIPVPVTVSFGKALPSTAKAWEVRQHVQELSSKARVVDALYEVSLPHRFLQMAWLHPMRKFVVDSNRKEIRMLAFMAKMLTLSQILKNMTHDREHVAILFPPSVDNTIVNYAVSAAGCVAVNLPYGASKTRYNSLFSKGDIQYCITSRDALSTLKIKPSPQMVYLEDIFEMNIWRTFKAVSLLYLLPIRLVLKIFGRDVNPHQPATVVLDVEEKKVVKAVVLSHRNIIYNVSAFEQICRFSGKNRMFVNIPSYNVFGYTAALWMPGVLGLDMFCNSRANPSELEDMSKVLKKYKVSVLIDTPTCYQAYLEHIRTEALSHVEIAFVGGSDLTDELYTAFSSKFCVDLLEGFGTEEMGPAISVNIPNYRHKGIVQKGRKLGSVGAPMPGVVARLISEETGEIIKEVNKSGILHVKSPGLMLGYWHDPAKTQAALSNGWFDTGYIASIDEDGFLFFDEDDN